MWQSLEILNDFNTFKFWNGFFGKRKPFSKNWSKIKTHHFLTRLTYHKPMWGQIEWWAKDHKERSFARNHFIFVSVSEPLTKSWFDVPTTQIPIFLLFLSVRVLFDGAFSPWVSSELLTILLKRSIFHAWLGPKCASANGYNVVVEIQTEISPW